MNYANIAWASTYKSKLKGLYRHQKHAALMIFFKDKFTHTQPLLHDMKALNIFQINLFRIIYFMCKYKEKIGTPIFHSLFTPKPEYSIKRKTIRSIEKTYHLTLAIVICIYGMNSLMIILVNSLPLFCKKIKELYLCFMIQNSTSNFSNFKLVHYLPTFLFIYPPKISLFRGVQKEKAEFSWINSKINLSFEFDTQINMCSRG